MTKKKPAAKPAAKAFRQASVTATRLEDGTLLQTARDHTTKRQVTPAAAPPPARVAPTVPPTASEELSDA